MTTALILIAALALLGLLVTITGHLIRQDRPSRPPASHTTDPRFVPPAQRLSLQ